LTLVKYSRPFELSDKTTKIGQHKKESPDVETPGLLVKALISSYFN